MTSYITDRSFEAFVIVIEISIFGFENSTLLLTLLRHFYFSVWYYHGRRKGAIYFCDSSVMVLPANDLAEFKCERNKRIMSRIVMQ